MGSRGNPKGSCWSPMWECHGFSLIPTGIPGFSRESHNANDLRVQASNSPSDPWGPADQIDTKRVVHG